jgi:hypothetical protein
MLEAHQENEQNQAVCGLELLGFNQQLKIVLDIAKMPSKHKALKHRRLRRVEIQTDKGMKHARDRYS